MVNSILVLYVILEVVEKYNFLWLKMMWEGGWYLKFKNDYEKGMFIVYGLWEKIVIIM